MNNKPLLSIAIPTYNHSKFLKDLLDSILSQLAKDVEIVVSDNCSPDETQELVNEYKIKCPNIKYFRNEINLGFDRNFINCVRRARGDYVWIIGDDDRLAPGAIEYIKKIIKNQSPGLIYINSRYFNINFKNPFPNPTVTKLISDYKFKSADECFRTLGALLGFISAVVAQRKIMSDAIKDENNYSSYLGGGYVNFYFVIVALTKKFSYFVAYPFIEARSGNSWASEQDVFRTFFIDQEKIPKEAKNLGYSFWTILKFVLWIRAGLVKRVIFARLNENKEFQHNFLQKMIKHYKFSPIFWLTAFPFFLIPNFLLGFFYRNIKSLKRKLY